jgi:hypothetical protein
MYAHDQESQTLEEPSNYARRELALKQRDSLHVTYTVAGHTNQGAVWAIDTMVDVNDGLRRRARAHVDPRAKVPALPPLRHHDDAGVHQAIHDRLRRNGVRVKLRPHHSDVSEWRPSARALARRASAAARPCLDCASDLHVRSNPHPGSVQLPLGPALIFVLSFMRLERSGCARGGTSPNRMTGRIA